MPLLADAILVDTSAAIALHSNRDRFHVTANDFFQNTTGKLWVVLNVTKHETYTRARYDMGFRRAINLYDFLTGDPLYQLFFRPSDEDEARLLLERYQEHTLSFHDALCATVMKRFGIYRVFTFDSHFYTFGFEVFPGEVY
ncbi:MAG TPA: PIN domain-containing protein [Nitrospirae bacterium]|nr:PIN domain-containing protein [Nitrospirota bacterium]